MTTYIWEISWLGCTFRTLISHTTLPSCINRLQRTKPDETNTKHTIVLYRNIPRPKAWIMKHSTFFSFRNTRQFVLESNHYHNDVITWKRFPPYWYFVRGIRQSPVDYFTDSHADLWHILVSWVNCWTNKCLAGIQYAMAYMWRHCKDNSIIFPYNTPKKTPISWPSCHLWQTLQHTWTTSSNYNFNYLWMVITGITLH